MSRLVYVCRFDIHSTEAEGFVLKEYKRWIERHYNTKSLLDNLTVNFDNPELDLALLPAGHGLSVETLCADEGTVRTISWSYPAENDNTLLWRNDIRIGSFDGSVALEHTIAIGSVDFKIAPAKIDVGSPRVIRRICSGQTVRIGDMNVRATPYQLDLDGIEQFIELLESPLRKLPLVFVSPYTTDEKNAINTVRMSAALAGVAVVVEATSAEVTWEIAEKLGRPLSCFDGAARIYWPGFSANDGPREHPLYLADRIVAAGPYVASTSIERTLFSVATFRFVPDPRMNAIVRAVQRNLRVEKIEEQKAGAGVDWEQYAIELDTELSSAKSRLTELEAENENLRANQKIFFTVRDEEAAEELHPSQPRRTPDNNKDAVAFAQSDFENLVILRSALQSAEESPFRRPQEIYDALGDLNFVARDWREQRETNGSGGDLRQHLINRGWGKRCSLQISDTTRSKYKNDYTFEYNGEKKLFEPHITIGSGDPNMCASIHFLLDHDTGMIVVAHVGRHLPNTKT